MAGTDEDPKYADRMRLGHFPAPVWGYPCLACRGSPLRFLQGAVVSLRVVQAHLGGSLAAGVVVRDQCLADGQPEAPDCGG